MFVGKKGEERKIFGSEALEMLCHKYLSDNKETGYFTVTPVQKIDIEKEWVYPKSDPDRPWSCAKDCKVPDTKSGCLGCPLA